MATEFHERTQRTQHHLPIKQTERNHGVRFLFGVASFFLICIAILLIVDIVEVRADDSKTLLYTYDAGDNIRQVSISDDGGRIVIGSANDKLYLFNNASSTPEWEFTAKDDIHSVTLSGDGQYLAGGANAMDRNVSLFGRGSSTPIWSHKTDKDPLGSGTLPEVDMSDDGNYIVAGSGNDFVYFWYRGSSTPVWKFKCDSNAQSVAIAGNGNFIVAGDLAGKVRLFHRSSGSPQWTYSVSGDRIRSVDIMGSGKYLVAGTIEGQILLWEKGSRTPVWSYDTGHQIWGVSISYNGDYIAACNEDGNVLLFHRVQSTPLWEYDTGGVNRNVKMADNGKYFIVGSENNDIYFFRTFYPAPFWTHTAGDDVVGVAISESGKISAGVSNDDSLYLFETDLPPEANIVDINKEVSLEGEEIEFDGDGYDYEDEIVQYEWNSSIDGILSDEEDFTSSILSVGEHEIRFRVKNENDIWSLTMMMTITVHTIPTAEISVIDPEVALDTDVVGFTGSGDDDGSIEQYSWTSDIDGEFFNGSNPMFDDGSLSTGNHTISLKVMDNHGEWSNPVTTTLTIHSRPVAWVESISPNPALNEDTVTMTGQGDDDGSVVDFLWNIDKDGEDYYSGKAPPTQFSVGDYDVSYSVQDNHGVWSYEDTMELIVHSRPTCSFDDSIPEAELLDETIHYIGLGDDDGFLVRSSWRSSIDGEFYNGSSLEFHSNFLSHGLHTITYRVRDNYNVWSHEVTMEIDIHTRPTVAITTISPSPALDTELLTFQGTSEDDGSVDYTEWNLQRNGQPYYQNSLPPEYLPPGSYNISYKAYDNHGIWSEEAFRNLIVHKRPVATIDPTIPSYLLVGEELHLSGTGSDDGSVNGSSWSSSLDGLIYSGPELEKSTSTLSHGVHTITFKVKDNHNVWSNETTITIDIHTPPEASIQSILPNPALNTDILSFNGQSSDDGSVDGLQWRLVKGGIEVFNGSSPQSPLDPGTYSVYFVVRDNYYVWSDEFELTLIVHEQPKATIDPTIPKKITDGDTITFKGSSEDDGTVVKYVWTSSIDGEMHNWTKATYQCSNLSVGKHVITFKVQDNHGVWSEDETFLVEVEEKMILYREIGPFPVYIYAILLVVIILISGIALKSKGKGAKPTGQPKPPIIPPPATMGPSPQYQPPPPQQFQPPPPQQQFQPPQPQLQAQQQSQFQPPQQPPVQQQPQQTASQMQQPAPVVGTWTCPQCTSSNQSNFAFCLKCGYKNR